MVKKQKLSLRKIGAYVLTDEDGEDQEVEIFEDLSDDDDETFMPFRHSGDGCPPGTYYDPRRRACVPVIRRKKREKCPPGFYYDARRGGCVPVIRYDRNTLSSGDWYTAERKAFGQGQNYRTGWRPSIPDRRDFPPNIKTLKKSDDPRASKLAAALSSYRDRKHKRLKSEQFPQSVDLREYCAEVEDQGAIGSCTAHAVVGLVEYFARRGGDAAFQGSRLFVYKVARRIAGLTGDSGAFIRSAMGAAVTCGVPPENHWPYSDDEIEFDDEPDMFVFSLAQNFQALSYFRYDAPEEWRKTPDELIQELKQGLFDELPFALGFYGFPSFDHPDVAPGDIPFPGSYEKAQWGHAVTAVGFDDARVVKNPAMGEKSVGAFLIRNSWGTGWGEDGYGWLPYDYVKYGLASDFWSLVDMEWLDSQQFE